MQDELADLLNRNMNISMQAPALSSTPPTPQVVPQSAPVYISQHYTHTAHIIPIAVSDETALILQNAGIDTNVLMPAQLHLFNNAQPDQQARLVELWRISPPTQHDRQASTKAGGLAQTSFEFEEQAARERWERQEQERLKNLSAFPSHSSAEPYMSSGYEHEMSMDEDTQQSHRPATDPVYDRQREWWHMADEQPMEHQYGMLQQMRMSQGFCGIVDRDRMW